MKIIAVEEIVINVSHAGSTIPDIGPGNLGARIDGQRERIEGATAAGDRDVGGCDRVAIGLRSRRGGRAGSGGRAGTSAWRWTGTGGLGKRRPWIGG